MKTKMKLLLVDLIVWLFLALILTLVLNKMAHIEQAAYVAAAIMFCTSGYARFEQWRRRQER